MGGITHGIDHLGERVTIVLRCSSGTGTQRDSGKGSSGVHLLELVIEADVATFPRKQMDLPRSSFGVRPTIGGRISRCAAMASVSNGGTIVFSNVVPKKFVARNWPFEPAHSAVLPRKNAYPDYMSPQRQTLSIVLRLNLAYDQTRQPPLQKLLSYRPNVCALCGICNIDS